MILALLRFLGLSLVRLFYPRIAVAHRERLLGDRPLLILANHPNGLLDPLVLRIGLGRPVAFLAKSTLFKNPAGRALMEAFGALPVYRPRDGEDSAQNEQTFARCRSLLFERRALAMFPEGTSHSDPKLKPLKTGAARIALSAEAERGFELGLSIVPIGLLYEDKDLFRSGAVLSVGAPIGIADLREDYQADARAAVEALTERIHQALGQVVLQAESSELWRGFLAVAAWSAEGLDPIQREARARELAAAYQRLLSEDPEQAIALERATRRFVRTLRAIGVANPLSLERAMVPSLSELSVSWLGLLLLAPFALLGAVLGWLPYRLVRPAAIAIARGEPDLIGTVKALLGFVLLALCYLAESVAAAHFLGAPVGAALLVLGPASGFLALRFDERLVARREALRSFWIRSTRARVAEAVSARRSELVEAIQQRLRDR